MKKIKIKGNVLLFADTSTKYDTIKDEFSKSFEPLLNKNGLFIPKRNIKFTHLPPFIKSQIKEIYYDVLLFDYGGFMSLGNDMEYHHCWAIVNEAEHNPNKHYVVISSFTELAMKEAKEEFKDATYNVFCSPKEYYNFLLKHGDYK